MVLVEEVDDEVPVGKEAKEAPPKKESTTLKVGFLDSSKEGLYGPEGSPEGAVAKETHKAHAEHKMNEDLNANMNRGAKDNNGHGRPEWYTKEWPKDCQYNAPGCELQEMATSTHATDIHREMVQGNERWQEALAPGVKIIRLSFTQMCDEDLKKVIDSLKGNSDVEELDLSHNKINDVGVQALVAALAAGAAPNLKELRIYSNEFGELGKTMLTQGLSILRKKLKVQAEEPSWKHISQPQKDAAPAAAAA